MTIDPDKYVVFKRRDWDQFMADWSPDEMVSECADKALTDAVVIRRQDVFAPSGLYAYANSIQTALEIIHGKVTVDEAIHMRNLADYFADQADKASRTIGRKVPD